MIDDPIMFARNSVRRHIIPKYIFEFDNHGKIHRFSKFLYEFADHKIYININEFYWRN